MAATKFLRESDTVPGRDVFATEAEVAAAAAAGGLPYVFVTNSPDTEPTSPTPKKGDLWVKSGGSCMIFIGGATWAQIQLNIS